MILELYPNSIAVFLDAYIVQSRLRLELES